MLNWVADVIAALPPNAVAPCPVCQGTAGTEPCVRCNDYGRVVTRTPKLPRQICGSCGAYVKHAERMAERCGTCQGGLPPWRPSRYW
jgi:hypothetical protein